MNLPKFIVAWLRKPEPSTDLVAWEEALEARLARRRALRADRSAAARKGWETRRAA